MTSLTQRVEKLEQRPVIAVADVTFTDAERARRIEAVFAALAKTPGDPVLVTLARQIEEEVE